MKRTIAVVELVLLLLILAGFVWTRFDGSLSSPFYAEMTTARLLLSTGITIAILVRSTQVVKVIGFGRTISWKVQLVSLGLYLLMIGTDLRAFVQWNIHAGMYMTMSIILLAPVLLGLIRLLLGTDQTPPNKPIQSST